MNEYAMQIRKDAPKLGLAIELISAKVLVYVGNEGACKKLIAMQGLDYADGKATKDGVLCGRLFPLGGRTLVMLYPEHMEKI